MEKHSHRLKEYKLKVPSFDDVDERLMSIDIDDLGVLIQHIMRKLIHFLMGYKVITKILLEKNYSSEEQLKWIHGQNNFQSIFDDKYVVFARDRNYIMHNKLIDRVAFKTIKELVEGY